jgi:mono/diheme cytochrome c family protein
MRESGAELGRVLVRIAAVFALYCGYACAIAKLEGRTGHAAAAHSADPQSGARYAAGRELWRAHACQTCHSIYGLGGHSGPDLTNVMRRESADYVRASVLGGRAGMPAIELGERELVDLVAYLAAIDATGTFPPRSLGESAFGDAP